MNVLLGLAILLCGAATPGEAAPGPLAPWSSGLALGGPRSERPHPAVVRIFVPNRGAHSLGSGVLVAVSRHCGLVLTNWHVVRDAAGPILVAFPDGFQSRATVLGTDRDWDLAALAICRPQAEPIPLAAAAPRPGEPLTIAGYGSGSYRTITGRCTQYVSPGRNLPFEIVELSAPARAGDSGGPIFNSRGELAGLLFGSASGQTAGSYSGRIRLFLAPVLAQLQGLESNLLAAEQKADNLEQAASLGATTFPPRSTIPLASLPTADRAERQDSARHQAPVASTGRAAARTQADGPILPDMPPASAAPSMPEAVTVALKGPPAASDQAEGTETGLWEEVKNVLAAIGGVAILFHTLRLFAASRPPTRESNR
ncbi:MAG: S1 family peptidase [Thermoguttaceae bacterium]